MKKPTKQFSIFISFLARLFDKGSDASSKRFYGAVGFMFSIAFIAVWRHDLISELLVASVSLIGLGILDKFGKK